jgi:YidC/Oxa1 family membrane protein insertase
MDRKSIIAIVVCFLVLIGWYPLMNKLYPPKRVPPQGTNAPATTLASTNTIPTASSNSAPAPPTVATSAGTSPSRLIISSNEPEQLVEITNALAHYTFSSYGGGLKLVELLKYKESTTTIRKKSAAGPVATLNAFTEAPTLTLLDGPPLQGDGIFKLTRTEKGVRAEKALTNGLVILKDFEISTNYVLTANIRLENRSSEALNLPAQDWFIGTATPMYAGDSGQGVGVIWYNGAKTDEAGSAFFSKTGFACTPRTPPAEYRRAGNVVWAAAHNQFFALAAMPQQPAAEVVVRPVTLTQATNLIGRSGTPPEGFAAAIFYPAATLAPGQNQERQIHLFAGPKEYQTLVQIGDRFNNNIDLIMGYGGFFGFFAKGLLLGMNWLHAVLRLPYGWAIIAITLIIKLLFWPLTQASTRSMKRMQALQPQMKAIQEKYKDDPAKMNRKTMEFMRENKVNPLGGCLPMLIQIPVFFGFYKMIQSAIELRGEPFLWIGDLSRPDTIFEIPGTGFPFNLLPLIMGVTMLWQARLTPPSPGMDPTQAKMMRYMPLMFMVFLYNFSAGLTLYWTVQNLLTIAQTKLTRTIPAAPSTVPSKGVGLTPGAKKRK